MLLIRIGAVERAVSLGQVSRVAKNPGVVPVPARAKGFVGVAGMRGTVLPVFSLAELLGLEESTPDWLLIVEGTQHQTVGFGCDQLSGYVRVEKNENASASVVAVGDQRYSVIDLYELRSRIELATRSKDEDGQ